MRSYFSAQYTVNMLFVCQSAKERWCEMLSNSNNNSNNKYLEKSEVEKGKLFFWYLFHSLHKVTFMTLIAVVWDALFYLPPKNTQHTEIDLACFFLLPFIFLSSPFKWGHVSGVSTIIWSDIPRSPVSYSINVYCIKFVMVNEDFSMTSFGCLHNSYMFTKIS